MCFVRKLVYNRFLTRLHDGRSIMSRLHGVVGIALHDDVACVLESALVLLAIAGPPNV